MGRKLASLYFAGALFIGSAALNEFGELHESKSAYESVSNRLTYCMENEKPYLEAEKSSIVKENFANLSLGSLEALTMGWFISQGIRQTSKQDKAIL